MLFGNKGRQKFGGSEGQILHEAIKADRNWRGLEGQISHEIHSLGLQLWVKAYWP